MKMRALIIPIKATAQYMTFYFQHEIHPVNVMITFVTDRQSNAYPYSTYHKKGILQARSCWKMGRIVPS